MDPTKSDSSSSTKKWLIGCGIGCGALVVIAILLGVGGYFFIKNIVEGFQDSEAIMSTLTERYGRVKEYCPDPDGSIKPERIEAFLEAREATILVREKLERSIQVLSKGEWEGEIDVARSGNVFQKIKIGFGLVPQIADFFKARNQALLEVEMGMGEYYFIYTMIYFSWLDKPVLDGPPFQIVGDSDKYRYDDWDDEEAQEIRQDITRRRLHQMLLPMLQNQYQKLIETRSPDEQDNWSKILSAEIEAMESDRYRLMWQDGLPEVIESSLQPFRQRLEDSYSPLLNALEIALEQR